MSRPKKKPPLQILVKRTRGNGDVFIASAVLPALKKRYPCSRIVFATACGDVLFGHPCLDAIVPPKHKWADPVRYDRVVYLDYAYELRRDRSMLEGFAAAAGVPVEECSAHVSYQAHGFHLPNEYLAMHAGTTRPWVGRDWKHDRFGQLCERLLGAGWPVVLVGDQRLPPFPGVIDLQHKANKRQLATILRQARFFIGIDSFPMHLAQAIGTPGLAFFGSVRPELRLFSTTMSSIQARHLPCLGCHHRNCAYNRITDDCVRGDRACEEQLGVDVVWEAVQAKLPKRASCAP